MEIGLLLPEMEPDLSKMEIGLTTAGDGDWTWHLLPFFYETQVWILGREMQGEVVEDGVMSLAPSTDLISSSFHYAETRFWFSRLVDPIFTVNKSQPSTAF